MTDTRNYFHPQCKKAGIQKPKEMVVDLYLSGMSTHEIAEHFFAKYRISITPRTLARYVVEAGKIRSPKEHKQNAIARGRMIYLKRPEDIIANRSIAGLKTRAQAMQRDNYRCQLCGDDGKHGMRLEVHHVDFDFTSQLLENLQTLCADCHKGLHALREVPPQFPANLSS